MDPKIGSLIKVRLDRTYILCAITGFFTTSLIYDVKRVAAQMLSVQLHQGPDGNDLFTDGCLALAHARLAIFDPALGAQPMQDISGRYVIVFNGAIYNYIELRNELKGLGFQFATASDTEVVVTQRLRVGSLRCSKSNGMFALAIWDCLDEELCVARDRLGIKPLYLLIRRKLFTIL